MRTSNMAFGSVGLAMAALAPMAIGQIAVNESSFPGGDFSGNLFADTIITPQLGLGVNTITGRVPTSVATSGNIVPDFDFFTVTFPAGTTISAISLSSSNYVAGTAADQSVLNGFYLPVSPNGTGRADVTGNGEFPLTYTLTTPNSLTFWVAGAFGNTGSVAGSFDYVLNLTVIPTPGATAMLGMGALAAARRRRR